MVQGILGQAALGSPTLAAVVGAVVPGATGGDQAALSRIARVRQQAVARYLRDRDTTALDAAMHRLDAEEARARQPREEEGVPADKAAQYLRELPATWAKAEGGRGRQLVADALFDRIEVLGLQEATAHLSNHAVRHGLADVLPEEFGISVSGRGERTQAEPLRVTIRIVARGRARRLAAAS